MAKPQPLTTTVSTKGQVILPKPVREALGWEAGARLIVEASSGGVRLQRVSPFPRTRVAEVAGCLAFRGEPKSLAEMEAGVLAEARRRHAGD